MTDSKNLRRISVSIAGRRYILTTDQPEDRVQELASLVDEKVHEVTQNATVAGINELMLAALSLAEDLKREKERYQGLKSKIRRQSEHLLSRLDVERFKEIA